MTDHPGDLVGRCARLLHTIETRGGRVIRKGRVVEIYSTWRGRFTLASTRKPKAGFGREVLVRHLDRCAFEVL